MLKYAIPLWKVSPFIRILHPFISGVIIQHYCQASLSFIVISFIICSAAFITFRFLNLTKKYFLRQLNGTILLVLVALSAMLIVYNENIKNNTTWFPRFYQDNDHLIVRIDQPPELKQNSLKALCVVESLVNKGVQQKVTGKLLVYFSRDSAQISYGYRIIISKKPDSILNNSNPGGFDYSRYTAFQQLYHSIYLGHDEYRVLEQKKTGWFSRFIYTSREKIVLILKEWLDKDKSISGIAEALLIGYKLDLDKETVQAYSNTGVVHIIAISGLHLGLIYFMLAGILSRLPFIKNNIFIKTVIILSSLWLFAILTGSSASVLRSAVMFTCIVIGSAYFKKASVYNSLAASAFILLCYDPFLLWDAGFQLTYVAVIGIIWLHNPIYRSIYIKNKFLLKVWSLLSVTTAAQIAAFPVCLYYFHQFPNVFLISNLIAVPLSSVILFAEIFLIAFSWISAVAAYTGKLISMLIALMNYIITILNKIPFAVTNNIYATEVSTFLLYGIVVFAAACILYKRKFYLLLFLFSFAGFSCLHVSVNWRTAHQNKIIVYNVPKHTAIDLITKNRYSYLGDEMDAVSQRYYLGPSRTLFKVTPLADSISNLTDTIQMVVFKNLKIVIVNKSVIYRPAIDKTHADILIISGNIRQKITDLVSAIQPDVIIFDSSNSLWKIEEWKKECTSLLLRFHSVPEQGAFVSDIN